MAPSAIAQRRTHNLLLFQKLLNLRDGASPFTLLLDTLEQSSQPVVREFITRAKVSQIAQPALLFICNCHYFTGIFFLRCVANTSAVLFWMSRDPVVCLVSCGMFTDHHTDCQIKSHICIIPDSEVACTGRRGHQGAWKAIGSSQPGDFAAPAFATQCCCAITECQ